MKMGQLTEDEWSSFTIATDTFEDCQDFTIAFAIKVSKNFRSSCLKQENPDLG